MKDEKSLVRSSSAEYLTYIASTGDGGVNAIYADENIWLTQPTSRRKVDTYQLKWRGVLNDGLNGQKKKELTKDVSTLYCLIQKS